MNNNNILDSLKKEEEYLDVINEKIIEDKDINESFLNKKDSETNLLNIIDNKCQYSEIIVGSMINKLIALTFIRYEEERRDKLISSYCINQPMKMINSLLEQTQINYEVDKSRVLKSKEYLKLDRNYKENNNIFESYENINHSNNLNVCKTDLNYNKELLYVNEFNNSIYNNKEYDLINLKQNSWVYIRNPVYFNFINYFYYFKANVLYDNNCSSMIKVKKIEKESKIYYSTEEHNLKRLDKKYITTHISKKNVNTFNNIFIQKDKANIELKENLIDNLKNKNNFINDNNFPNTLNSFNLNNKSITDNIKKSSKLLNKISNCRSLIKLDSLTLNNKDSYLKTIKSKSSNYLSKNNSKKNKISTKNITKLSNNIRESIKENVYDYVNEDESIDSYLNDDNLRNEIKNLLRQKEIDTKNKELKEKLLKEKLENKQREKEREIKMKQTEFDINKNPLDFLGNKIDILNKVNKDNNNNKKNLNKVNYKSNYKSDFISPNLEVVSNYETSNSNTININNKDNFKHDSKKVGSKSKILKNKLEDQNKKPNTLSVKNKIVNSNLNLNIAKNYSSNPNKDKFKLQINDNASKINITKHSQSNISIDKKNNKSNFNKITILGGNNYENINPEPGVIIKDGSKIKDGGVSYNNKYGKISINDYRLLQEENKLNNKKVVNINNSEDLNINYNKNNDKLNDSKHLKTSVSKITTKIKLSEETNKLYVNQKYKFSNKKESLELIPDIIAKEFQNLDIFKKNNFNSSNNLTKSNNSTIKGINFYKNVVKNTLSTVKSNLTNNQKMINKNSLNYVNNFNKDVMKNQYWGDQKAVDMICNNKVNYSQPNQKNNIILNRPRFSKNGLIELKIKKPIKDSLAGKKLPNLSLRERNKITVLSSDTIPFVL